MTCIEKYSLFEYRFTAKVQKPFSMEISARFLCPDGRKVVVRGFYDGEDTFAVRFMPEQEGLFRFEILCGNREINGISGAFECVSSNRHGRVIPKGKYLETIDGSRHFSAGTTCYAWIYQPEHIREETIAELGKGYFNKIRMCVFPKHYLYNEEEPDIYPFVGTPGYFHYDTPNVKLFQRLDACVAQLNDMDIQADIILFHPYDKDSWGFSKMNRQQDEAYIRYVTARLGAYANVWWSAANEYDLFRNNYPLLCGGGAGGGYDNRQGRTPSGAGQQDHRTEGQRAVSPRLLRGSFHPKNQRYLLFGLFLRGKQ